MCTQDTPKFTSAVVTPKCKNCNVSQDLYAVLIYALQCVKLNSVNLSDFYEVRFIGKENG